MIAEIDRCRDAGDTAGGAFEVIVRGLPVGLGSYVQWDRKLDGRLAQAMMSIPAIKGVGIGIGPKAAAVPGSQMHDEIRAGARTDEAAHWRGPADQQRRRPRRRRHQRRRSQSLRIHEADRDADEAAAIGRPGGDDRSAGRHRAERRVRDFGGGGRRRSGGQPRARRRVSRKIQRRLARRNRAQLRRRHRAAAGAVQSRRSVRARSGDSPDPEIRRGPAARARRRKSAS